MELLHEYLILRVIGREMLLEEGFAEKHECTIESRLASVCVVYLGTSLVCECVMGILVGEDFVVGLQLLREVRIDLFRRTPIVVLGKVTLNGASDGSHIESIRGKSIEGRSSGNVGKLGSGSQSERSSHAVSSDYIVNDCKRLY